MKIIFYLLVGLFLFSGCNAELRTAKRVSKKIRKLEMKHPRLFENTIDTQIIERIVPFIRDSITTNTVVETQITVDSFYVETETLITKVRVERDTVNRWYVETVEKLDTLYSMVTDTVFIEKKFIPTEVTVEKKFGNIWLVLFVLGLLAALIITLVKK